jgi:putative flippase GtrA
METGAGFREALIPFPCMPKGERKLNTAVRTERMAQLLKLYSFKYPAIYQFLKFCAVGFLGLIVDTVVLVGLVEAGRFDPRTAAVFAFVAAVSFNYLLNRMWTFDAAKTTKIITSYTWFVTVYTVGLLVRLGVMHFLIESFRMRVGYRYVLASAAGISLATIVNFAGARFVAFPDKLRIKRTVT